ncbi:hypothetical protein [Agrobacterium tumefaciens]|uniref:portal protein n=1 Tax=Agrobacterium tumefaciens TaxID=358 RepID=UPI003B9FED2A
MEDIQFHGWLIDMFTDAEDGSDKSRKGAEKYLDYYNNRQWTQREAEILRKRGQPVVSFNLVRNKIDYLQGLERQQRTQPRALPRTPMHEQDSQAVTDSLRYVCDDQGYSDIKSLVWGDMLKAGWGGVEVTVRMKRSTLLSSTMMTEPDYDVKLTRCAWDRMFWDPHSSEDDFSDATYLGLIIWMDREEAVRRYGEGAAAVFDETVSIATTGETFDDKPKFSWVHSARRKRIRVIQMYFIGEDGQWSYAEFTKGGILRDGPSPWLDEDGEREHPYAWRSSYTDRDNGRYGPIRDLVDPQDEINKRRSKKLHLDTSRQTFGNDAYNSNVKENKKQLQKADGHITLTGPAKFGEDFGIIPTNDQSQGHMQLLEQAMAVFEVMGPNAAMQGKQAGQQSGRAIIAQQQGGQTQMGLLTDALRQMDMDAYRKMWNRIRQFWTGERWIRVTDDMRNLRWVGLNTNPMSMPPGAVPEGANVSMMQGKLAEIDIDIILDDAPAVGALMDEQFSLIVDLKRMDTKGEIPFKAVIAAAPNLRSKGELLKAIGDAEQQPPNPMAIAGAQAEVATQQATAKLRNAQAEKAMADARQTMMPSDGGSGQSEIDYAKAGADIRNTEASTQQIMAETDQTRLETTLAGLGPVPWSILPGAGVNGQPVAGR